MKKLNFVLKLVVLAVFAGVLGLAGNGLNREVCAMDNFGCSDSYPPEYYEGLIKYLQDRIEKLNFPKIYQELQNAVKDKNNLSPKSRETARIRCHDKLNLLQGYITNLQFIIKKCPNDSKSEKASEMESFLKKMFDDYCAIWKDLTGKVWPTTYENICENHESEECSEESEECSQKSEECVMENIDCSVPYLLLSEYCEKLFSDLQDRVEKSNFPKIYQELQKAVKVVKDKNTLSSESMKAALTQCNDSLNLLQGCITDLQFIKNNCLSDSKLAKDNEMKRKVNEMESFLRKMFDDYCATREVLTGGVCVNSDKNICEIHKPEELAQKSKEYAQKLKEELVQKSKESEYCKELFIDLQESIKISNFSEKYKELNNVVNDRTNMNSELLGVFIERCDKTLEAIEEYINCFNNIKISEFSIKSREFNDTKRYLKDMYDKFVEIYKALSGNDWVSVKERTSQTVCMLEKEL